ncbi:DUF58 domain-containing protein [Actinocorallia sp. A-T 12471]|uniref:DUF58 domain-containing protein n=1 Tax=Actinocorallia sp. A-T 12471 TaxID=3089813 RepID=UPI0029CE225A|nr:DUF58 domain-containing protein [Actinocorallia sp. A-T 12471]MDX6743082.1 DUF58 domain-containing protein [Actinocorallia sp. A-T 12471]
MGFVTAALEALTTRGRSFVAAGFTAVVCSFLLGERDLLRAGLLILLLPLISALAVSRTRYRLACARRLWPSRLPAGHEARADLRLENVSKLPSGLLLVEDRVPFTLGGRARFVLDRIEPHGFRELSYRLRSDVRGRFRVGPLTVRLADPFGLVELARSFSLTDTLTITPRIVDLPSQRMLTSWDGDGESRSRAIAVGGEDDLAPREYRRGDDLRRVHWRSTARYGELMVRREEQQWQRRATLLLDTRRSAHPSEEAFELAVSVAASVGVHLAEEGLALRLATDAGREAAVSYSAGAESGGELLDALAVVSMSEERSFVPGVAALTGTGAGGVGGLVVAVLGRLTDEEAVTLAAAGGNAAPIALLTAGEGAQAAATLHAAGWRVLAPTSLEVLPSVWAGAGQ